MRKLTRDQFNKILCLVEQGLVNVQEHPVYKNIKIYNYSPKATNEDNWDIPELCMCRGLVVDTETLEIIISCIPKFFNQGQRYAKVVNINDVDTRISVKEDGYMIQIRVHPVYGLIVTSRGSFESKYAKTVYDRVISYLEDGTNSIFPNSEYSYICELCQDFPGDEGIIVTKHPIPRLVCYAIIDEKLNGEIQDLSSVPLMDILEKVKEFDPDDAIDYLKNEVEGIVLYNKRTGDRVKVKTDWFLRMHRIISDCTRKRAFEICKENIDIDDLDLPDEFLNQMKTWVLEIKQLYMKYVGSSHGYLSKFDSLSDKEIAQLDEEKIPKFYMHLVFALRKGKIRQYEDIIWKQVEKEYVKEN